MPRKKDPNAAKAAPKPRAAKAANPAAPVKADPPVEPEHAAGTLADLKPEAPAVPAAFGIGARRVPRAESAEG